jgi:hypothetical protein
MEAAMAGQSFAILRVQRLKTRRDLHAATRHGRREDGGQHYDRTRTPFNLHWAAGPVVGPVDWAEGVDCAIRRLGAKCRKGAPVAAEFFVGASPEYFDPVGDAGGHFNMARVMAWAEATMAAFYERHGEAVVAGRLDLDEGSPHMAICVLPVYTKTTRYTRTVVVSYRKVFGGETKQEARDRMIELQDWYAEKMAPLGLVRGIPKTITGRTHLSHHQYARKRRQEDEARALALRQAQEREVELARRLTEVERELAQAARSRTVAHENARKATRILLEAEKARAFVQQTAEALAAYDPNAEIARVMAAKDPALTRWDRSIEQAMQDLAAIEAPDIPKPK